MIKINLLPHKKVKPVEKGIIKLWIGAIAVSVVVIIGLAGWYFMLSSSVSDISSSIADADAELKKLASEVKQVEGYKKTRADLEEKLAIITQIENIKIPMTPLLNELNRIMTKDVWVTRMSVREADFAIDFSSQDRNGIAPFFDSMKKSTVFSNLQLDDSGSLKAEAAKTKKYPFTVKGKLAGYEEVRRPVDAPKGKPAPKKK